MKTKLTRIWLIPFQPSIRHIAQYFVAPLGNAEVAIASDSDVAFCMAELFTSLVIEFKHSTSLSLCDFVIIELCAF